jgi:hypothetical protein
MQTLSNYLLSAESQNSANPSELASSVLKSIDEWLLHKGADEPSAVSGEFQSLTPGAVGKYSRSTVVADTRTLFEIRLDEPSKGGQSFTTTVSVVFDASRIDIFVSQTVRNSASIIAPVITDPRCPGIVRRILKLPVTWSFSGEKVPAPVAVSHHGEAAGTSLAEQIKAPTRFLPLVIVSENEGEPIWPKIASELAYDLAALAKVASIDDSASWSLTNELGKVNSCYMGAIRLYWPSRPLPSGESQARSTVWTASTLLSNDHDGKGALRFRSTLRKTVMGVSALTVEPPNEIKEVQNFAARQQLRELEKKATSNSEELEMARMFYADNEQLRNQITDLQREVATWSSRAEMAEYALAKKGKGQDVQDDSIAPTTEDELPPKPGETRFYKKTHSTPNHDVFVLVTDCGHSSWQDTSKAEKAKKGFRRLLGDSDWKTLHHCGMCTGGGVWRVRW